MVSQDTETIRKDLAEINRFVRERLDPVTQQLDLLSEESERLSMDVSEIQRRERASRRDAIMRQADEGSELVVPEGPYAGLGVLDLALLCRFAYSQRRESFGPAWIERAQEAKRLLIGSIDSTAIQSSHEAFARRLSAWFTVDRKPTGQFETFSRSVLQSLTRAAMDSTTAGSGDELVATLEARDLWLDVNLQTLVASLVPTFQMPSNPFDIPRQLGNVNFYPGTENISTTSTALGTGKSTLTAYELVGQVPYSFTLEEDAVIALLPEIRAGLARNVAESPDWETSGKGLRSDISTRSTVMTTAKTSGQDPFVFAHREELSNLPPAALEQEVNLHGTFAVDTRDGYGQIYYGMPGCGIMRVDPDLQKQGIISLPDEFTPLNFHSTKIEEIDGNRRLFLAANDEEMIVVLTLDGEVDFTLPRPVFDEYQSQQAEYKPTDTALVGDQLYVADGYASNYIVSADVKTRRWTGIFGGKTEDSEEDGKFATAHGINVNPTHNHLDIADRPSSRIQVHGGDGRFLASHKLPSGSWPCGISYLEYQQRWYAVIGCLYDDPEERRPAPIFILDAESYEILSTIRPKEDLGIELGRRGCPDRTDGVQVEADICRRSR